MFVFGKRLDIHGEPLGEVKNDSTSYNHLRLKKVTRRYNDAMQKNRQVLVAVFFGFAGGIALYSFFDLGFSFVILNGVLGSTLLFYWHFYFPQQRILLYGVLVIFSATLGMYRFETVQGKYDTAHFFQYIGQQVSLKGIVVDEPDVRERTTRIVLQITEKHEQHIWTDRVLVTTDQYPEWRYGDEVTLVGELILPENFRNSETGRVFDYVSYLAKDGIHFQMFYPEIKLLDRGKGNWVRTRMFSLKTMFLNRIARIFPEPHGALLGGLLVGAKQSLGEDLLGDFRATGIIHIVVLSGYNITIVADAIMRTLAIFPRVIAYSFGATSIILFAIMTGAGATVVRASIMALLVIIARATGRMHTITVALMVAAFLMLLHNPFVLIFDPSFQLSFLATIGLIYLAPILEKKMEKILSFAGARALFVATVATQIVVLPLLLYQMGEFSLVAVPVNLLVLPTISLTMLFGFLAGTVSMLGTIISFPFSAIAYGLLSYVLFTVHIFSSLPFASIIIPTFPVWIMIALYGVLSIFLVYQYEKSEKDELYNDE